MLDSQIERDATALKAELADLKAEHARADKQAKAKLQAKINSAKAKLEATQDRAKAASQAAKREMDAKIKSLKEQVAKAKGDAKAKLEARIAEVQSEYKRRSGKLHQAWELTKEALALGSSAFGLRLLNMNERRHCNESDECSVGWNSAGDDSKLGGPRWHRIGAAGDRRFTRSVKAT